MAKSPRKPDGPAPRRNGVREVGALLPDVGGMAFRRFGFSQGVLISRWGEVAGPVYARHSVPQTLKFPRGETSGGTLTVLVEGAFALQLQHVAPQLVERVNAILGHNAVSRLKLVQGEVPRPPAQRAPPARVDAGAAGAAGQTPSLAGIADEGLRSALEDLAAQLSVRTGPPRVE